MPAADWLLCDADDTLWENNIYFERAIEEFVACVDHPVLSPAGVRERLDRVEARNTKLHGYGAENFARNLVECYESLRGRAVSEDEARRLREITRRVVDSPVEPIPGVRETLRELSARYRLGLVTKGDYGEQHGKLDRSGLRGWFSYVANVPEKDADCYRSVIGDIKAAPDRTWMIGNSPKSDINPALAAGLGAVLVRNDNTWRLEMQDIAEGHERFRSIDRFSDLTSIF